VESEISIGSETDVKHQGKEAVAENAGAEVNTNANIN